MSLIYIFLSSFSKAIKNETSESLDILLLKQIFCFKSRFKMVFVNLIERNERSYDLIQA